MTMKTLKMAAIALLLASLALVFGCASQSGQQAAGASEMNSTQCAAMGGRVVNTLGGKWCDWNETSTGRVTGLRCECTCCVPK